jgi:hypothetical protein
MGCEMVANKLTGERGILFTAAYVTRFNEMEAAERAEMESRSATPQLRVFNTAVKNVLSGFYDTYANPDDVMDFLRGAYKPFGIEVSYGGGQHFYTATDIADGVGIYSETGRPHGHAVASIIEKLNPAPEHIAIIPYGFVGVTMRYDYYVFRAVNEWVIENNFPCDVPHQNFNYHLYYDRQLSMFNDENL